MTNLTISEQLANSTVRIVCELENNLISTGTGFFFKFLEKENGEHLLTIITNKHVVSGAKKGKIVFNLADENGNLIYGQTYLFDFEDFENLWIDHPDSQIDLCVFPIGGIPLQIEQTGKKFSCVQFDKTVLPSKENLAELTALEDIVMIGYPNGIWDEVNNMPILRKGITATHSFLDYNGREEFIIDAACFPGSSGSPILLYNPTSYKKRDGTTVFGTRVYLLGVLYAGPQYTATGEIEIVTIPTQNKAMSFSQIPINLGYVIKSKKILDFEEILQKLVDQHNNK